MLAALLERRGAEVRASPARVDADGDSCARPISANLRSSVLSYMNADSLAHARFLVRRVRRRWPKTKVIVGFLGISDRGQAAARPARRDPCGSRRDLA